MALQAGISTSKVLVLAGAGWTVSVVLRSGRLSELIAQLQVLLRGVDEAEISSEKYDSAALTAQIRQLAQEIRELAVSHPVTVFNGNSASSVVANRYGLERPILVCKSHLYKDISINTVAEILALVDHYNATKLKDISPRFAFENQGSYASYLVPAAALGAMGYCYMWWKGWSLSDVMFVTKHNMANAVATVSKQLENVNEALSATKRHLTQKLENLDWKVEEHKETSKLIANDVNEVKSNLSQIGFDVESIHQMLSGLEGKIELLESKQDMTNSGLWYLCQVAGGFKDGLNAKLFKQEVGDTVANHSTITFEETSLKGLQFIADTKDSGVIDKSMKTTRIIDRDNFPGEKARTLKNRIHRSYPVGMSLAEIL